MGAGAVAPGAGEVEGDAAGFAGEGFDGDHGGAAEGDVVVEEPEEAEEAVVGPEDHDGDDVRHLRERADLGVLVDAEDDEDGEELVEVEEGFVEGVPDGGGGLDEDDDHGDGAEEAVLDEGVGAEGFADALDAFDVYFVRSPGTGVDDGFEDDDPTDPSVEEVEGVERDPEDPDQRIIPACEEEEPDHVDNAEMAGTSSELGNQHGYVFGVVLQPGAIDDIAGEVDDQDQGVQSRWHGADVDCP